MTHVRAGEHLEATKEMLMSAHDLPRLQERISILHAFPRHRTLEGTEHLEAVEELLMTFHHFTS